MYRPTSVEDVAAFTRINLFVEYRARPSLWIRGEMQNIPADNQPQKITVYNGARNTAAVAYVDDKRVGVSRFFFFRIRKTFD